MNNSNFPVWFYVSADETGDDNNNDKELVIKGSFIKSFLFGGVSLGFAIMILLTLFDGIRAQDLELIETIVLLPFFIFPCLIGIYNFFIAFIPPVIIINRYGISCRKWPFTLIPWADIKHVRLGSMITNHHQTSLETISIYLQEPGKYQSNRFSTNPLERYPRFLSTSGDGSHTAPLELGFNGLNVSAREAYEFVHQHFSYPETQSDLY